MSTGKTTFHQENLLKMQGATRQALLGLENIAKSVSAVRLRFEINHAILYAATDRLEISPKP